MFLCFTGLYGHEMSRTNYDPLTRLLRRKYTLDCEPKIDNGRSLLLERPN